MISINVNSAASGAGLNLGKSNEALQKSLSRLSSGKRIVNSSDDAGGLAVSMKMSAAQKRTEATAINLQNAQSFLQTQDGAYSVADKVLSRMSELATLANDPTKNPDDKKLYNKEFQNLILQIQSLGTEKFNGVNLFSETDNDTLTVSTSEDGSQSLDLTRANLTKAPKMVAVLEQLQDVDHGGPSTGLTGDNAKDITIKMQDAIQYLADMRAQNGAEASRVGFAQDLLKINAINLEAANSRIIDVDVAAESSQLARFQILQQAGTAMLGQANTSQQSLVRLLQG
jgi:flagellin